jgi:hypothetical protein
MDTATTTADSIISSYAGDIAFVAEEPPAADLGAFIDQLYTAARRFSEGGINGYEDVEDAAVHLSAARRDDADDMSRAVFLRQADELLENVWDMTQDYRLAAGD